MTREEIEETFLVEDGTIRSLGKFQGERSYMPHFYDLSMNGEGDGPDRHGVMSFVVTPKDKEQWPELRTRKRVRLVEDDYGFVIEVRRRAHRS